MLFANDTLFDPNDTHSPFFDEYKAATDIIRAIYDKNQDENGNRKLVLISPVPVKRNRTGFLEPETVSYIPYTATATTKDSGYSVAWRYSKSAPVFDNNGRRMFVENGMFFSGKMTLNYDELDKAFFLLFKSPLCSIERKSGSVAYVLNDRAKALNIVKENEDISSLEFYIFNSNSPLANKPEKIFKLSKAWGVSKIQHIEKMYNHYVGLTDMASADEFLADCKVKLKAAVSSEIQNGQPIKKFVDAVIKDQEWIDVKLKLIDAINNKYIKYDSALGSAKYDIGGNEISICVLPANKRSNYIDELTSRVMLDDESLEILKSLDSEVQDFFDPKMVETNEEAVNELKFHEKKALAKWLELDVPKSTKSKQLTTMILDEYKRRGLV